MFEKPRQVYPPLAWILHIESISRSNLKLNSTIPNSISIWRLVHSRLRCGFPELFQLVPAPTGPNGFILIAKTCTHRVQMEKPPIQ